MNLDPIKVFIKQRLGLQFAEHSEDSLRRALKTRIARSRATSAAAYLERLRIDEAELHELTSLLTINETYFYREPQHLQLLTGVLAPRMLARQGAAGKMRILSVGCSTGEEPYSIAIALREQYGQTAERLFQISAGDVDRQAVEKARAGIYSAYSFRTLPAALARRYFTTIDDQYRRIDETIHRQVSFHHVNVLAEAYPEDWFGQDVVFFRNVSIYFDAQTRQAIQRRLLALLKPGGALIVGATETLSHNFGLMALQEQDGVFFFCNAPAGQTDPSPRFEKLNSSPRVAKEKPGGISTMRPAAAWKSPLTPLCPREEPALQEAGTPINPGLTRQAVEALYQNALALAREQRFDEALQRLAPLCVGDAPLACCLTLQGHLLLERRDLAGATAAVERALALEAWSVDALILQGRIARFRGDPENAIRHFRQAVYDSPHCWPAHYHLAELYRDNGQAALASREYRIVLRQLEDNGQAVRAAGLLPLAVSIQDLRFLCETQLSRLGQAAG